MTLGPEFGLSIAGGDDGGAAAHAAQRGRRLQTQCPGLLDDQVGNFVRLQMSPHVFHRIEFRSIGGQAFDRDAPPRAGHVIPHQGTAVNGGSIPEDEQLAGQVALKVLQELDHLRPFDAAGVHLKVEAEPGQPANQGKAFPIEGLLEQGGLATRGPSPHARGPCAQPAFVEEDDEPPLAARFFLIAGHSTRFHRRMAGSSRSSARRSGR